MHTGLRVHHPEHGAGTVRMRRGRELLVDFDARRGLPQRIRVAEFAGFAEAPRGTLDRADGLTMAALSADAAGVDSEPPPGPERTRHEDLMLIEALRLGVVPSAQADACTVGRREVLQRLGGSLDRVRTTHAGAFEVVLGDYGTGKSHLLEWLRDQALRRGFLVAQATLGRDDVDPAFPKRVYRALLQNLAYPDSDGRAPGLRPLLERMAQRPARPAFAPDYHKILDAVLQCFVQLNDAEAGDPELLQRLVAWIEGHPGGENVDWNRALHGRLRKAPYLYALADFRTFAHVYAYILGGIAVHAQECGWSGLVLLLDEAEGYCALGVQARELAENVFRCYALAALGAEGVRFDPAAIRRGGQAIHRSIPAVYRARQPLYCAFALTPDNAGVSALGRCVALDQHVSELDELTVMDFRRLCSRLLAAYARAHPRTDLSGLSAELLADTIWLRRDRGTLGNPRAAVRLVVDCLDIARLRPEAIARHVSELRHAG